VDGGRGSPERGGQGREEAVAGGVKPQARTQGLPQGPAKVASPATMRAALSRPDPRWPSSSRRGAARVAHRVTVRRVDPRSVLKVSLLFYLAGVMVCLVVGLLLWVVAVLSGAIHGIDHFVEQLFGYQSFSLAAVQVLLGILAIGVLLALLGTAVNVIVAIVYNEVSRHLGGVEVTYEEGEPVRTRWVASRSRSGL